METDMRLFKVLNDSGSYLVLPVERKTVTRFALKNHEVKALGSKGVTIKNEVVDKYLSFFLEKYFDNNLIENKIRTDNFTSKDLVKFEYKKKDNFYTIDDIKTLKQDIEEKKNLLRFDYNNSKLFKYKREVFKKIDEPDFKKNIRSVVSFYDEVCGYLDDLIKLDSNKYVISFIEQ